MTHGRGHIVQRTETTTGGTATTGILIMRKRADTTTGSGRKSMTVAMRTDTERKVGTTDTQMTAMVRRGKRDTTVMTTAAATRTDTDIDGTLTRMDGEVRETVTHK